MIDVSDKSQCSGCSACTQICAHNAIVMEPDIMGFFYPKLNEKLCVNCGLCEKVCAFNDDYDRSENLISPISYGVRHKDLSELQTSRSGASFIAISDYILQQGGVVYGSGFVEHFKVSHKRATTKEQVNDFKGSKYVQSCLGDIFQDVVSDLKHGRLVLFTGTSCQTAGLRSFVKMKRLPIEKLYCCDLVCHGVPAPYLWRDYLAYIERSYKDVAIAVSFRDKSRYGWSSHEESISFNSKKYIGFTYSYLFYKNYLRRSCFVCHYKNSQMPSDFTLADFWEWKKFSNDFNADNLGVSLLLLNSEKAVRLFEIVKEKVTYMSVDYPRCMQHDWDKPTPKPQNIDKFENDYQKYGLVYVLKKYSDQGVVCRVKNRLRRVKNNIIK